MKLTWITILLLGLCSCSDSGQKPCPELCPRGESCDESKGICVPAELKKYDLELPPAKNVRLAAEKGQVFVAMVDPVEKDLLAGELRANTSNLVVLAGLRSADKHVQISTSGGRVVVAWLGDSGLYEIAYRPIKGKNTLWTFKTLKSTTAYVGSEEFDVAIGPNGDVQLAFQGSDSTLKLLHGDLGSTNLKLELVDDGGPSNNGIACPNNLRDNQAPSGVGLEPSISIGPETLAISYFDADCGDLRLAQRGNESVFLIDVVDTGTFEGELAPARRGRTGRYSSLAQDPSTGKFIIAYMDEARAQVMIATPDETGYQLEVVDDGVVLDEFARERKSLVGAFTEISINAGGATTITYMNASATEVVLARRPNGGSRWFHQTLMSDGLVGFSADHVITEEAGLVVVSERLQVEPDAYSSTLEARWE